MDEGFAKWISEGIKKGIADSVAEGGGCDSFASSEAAGEGRAGSEGLVGSAASKGIVSGSGGGGSVTEWSAGSGGPGSAPRLKVWPRPERPWTL